MKKILKKTGLTGYSRLRMLEKMDLVELRNKISRFKDAYHNGDALISDEEYDALESELRRRVPNDSLLTNVGAAVIGKKVALPYKMPSLSKVKTEDGSANKWLKKNTGEVTVSDKVDGTSALVAASSSGTYRMYTRGDGSQGQDITYIIDHITGIGKLKAGEAVRGELVIPSTRFSATWAKEFSDPRSLVNGAVNSKKADRALLADMLFVAHEFVNPSKSLKSASTLLLSRGFNVVTNTTMSNPTPEDLDAYVAARKKKAGYEIDGVVLESNSDKVAFKVASEVKQTTVVSVEWKLSKYKLYKPVVITKPIRLSGVNVTRFTGYNASYIIENGIGPGAVILVTRSGEVIPKVVGVIKLAKPSLPSKYIWDKNKVDILGEPSSKKEELELIAKQLSEALRVLEVPNIRERSLLKLAENGIADLRTLFRSDVDALQEAGLGPTQANQLYTSLRSIKLTATTAQMMKASGLWERGYGITRFEAVLSAIPYEKLRYMTDAALIKAISDIPGFSLIYARKFVPAIQRFDSWIRSIPWKEKPKVLPTMNSPIAGHVVVFTGFRDADLEKKIKSLGGTIGTSVTGATTILVSSTNTSLKVTKAKKMNIPVYSPTAFIKKYKLER